MNDYSALQSSTEMKRLYHGTLKVLFQRGHEVEGEQGGVCRRKALEGGEGKEKYFD